jgi:hypothetical protein
MKRDLDSLLEVLSRLAVPVCHTGGKSTAAPDTVAPTAPTSPPIDGVPSALSSSVLAMAGAPPTAAALPAAPPAAPTERAPLGRFGWVEIPASSQCWSIPLPGRLERLDVQLHFSAVYQPVLLPLAEASAALPGPHPASPAPPSAPHPVWPS